MIAWHTVRARDGRAEIVEAYDDMAAALEAMVATSWEEPGNAWLSYLADEAGLVAATAIFGPEMTLLVTCSDGRRLECLMPESYRGA